MVIEEFWCNMQLTPSKTPLDVGLKTLYLLNTLDVV